MTDPDLGECKKARTRRVIADAAARLFAERGYEHFQTKDQLVTDRDQLVRDELSRRIRTRAPGTTPAVAIREFVLGTVEGIRRIPAGQWRGELGFLAVISPAVHRLSLEMSDRQATALAAAIAETEAIALEIAKLRGIALASVFQIIITEAGRRTREGQSQDLIAGSCGQPSKRSSMTSTAGSPRPQNEGPAKAAAWPAYRRCSAAICPRPPNCWAPIPPRCARPGCRGGRPARCATSLGACRTGGWTRRCCATCPTTSSWQGSSRFRG